MEIDDGACSSSDDEGISVAASVKHPHTAEIKVDMGTEEAAKIVCRTLQVDKEPRRSNAERSLSVEGSSLVMHVASVDRRSLQKSIANLFDMCDLAKSTIDLATKKSWLEKKPPISKKRKLTDGCC